MIRVLMKVLCDLSITLKLGIIMQSLWILSLYYRTFKMKL